MLDPIDKAARPVADLNEPLNLTLHNACALARAVANNDATEAALAALPPSVRARFTNSRGQPDAAFSSLYDPLRETEPAF